MKKIVLIIIGLVFGISCGQNKKENIAKENEKPEVTQQTKTNVDEEGYELMKKNCFVCHMEKPDPSKKGQMIAPPMQRIQAHYKPAYPQEEEFVAAVTQWVKNPREDNAMMPGAIRKFNLMPPLNLPDEDLKKIAKALYNTDFGNLPKMNKGEMKKLTLNNGKKWKIDANAKSEIKQMQALVNNFDSNNLEDYNQLGKEVFAHAKNILLDDTADPESVSKLQIFLHNIEENIHQLMGAGNLEEAKKQKEILQKKLNKFDSYFE